jgi:hypothetical protein
MFAICHNENNIATGGKRHYVLKSCPHKDKELALVNKQQQTKKKEYNSY